MNNIKELTLRGMILGALITVVFTASNVYLGLKVGLTFSSAIPAAVISMAILRSFSGSTILENNMVQTQASAAGTLSSIIFVLPGLLMIGYWQNFPLWTTMAICSAGGMLGVLFSIPLRHVMVVKSDLPYPEGVAAAEILKASHSDEENKDGTTSNKQSNNGLKDILFGSAISAVVSVLTNGFRVISDSTAYWFTQGKAIIQLPMGFSLALLSAGYLVGIVSGIAILIGNLIAWGVIEPILSASMVYSSDASLSDIGMGLWSHDLRFIGAGTLAIAAVWTLLSLIKPVIEGLKVSFRSLKADNNSQKIARVEQDLSPKTILMIMFAMLVILVFTFHHFVADSGLSASTGWILIGSSVIFAFVIGFLVAAACGYMAGLVGSSASPISGIGIIAVTIISLVLLGIGELDGMLGSAQGTQFATALSLFTTSVVLAIATISNDNLQDLKTGYLVKATPWRQQVALLVGCVVGSIVIAPVLDILYHAYGFSGALPRADMDPSQVLPAPQATLMTTIAKGIFSHKLEWNMVIIGLILGAVIIAIDLILAKRQSKFRLPALAVGMGIYLPPTITTPLIVGAILSWVIRKLVQKQTTPAEFTEIHKKVDRKAALISSGFIVGESLIGVILAVFIVISISNGGEEAPLSLEKYMQALFGQNTSVIAQCLGLAIFALICFNFVRRAMSAIKPNK